MFPGNKISADQPEAVHWFKAPPVGPDSYQEERLLLNAMQLTSAINDYLAPSQGSDTELNRTARGIQAIQQQSGLIFSLTTKLFEAQDVEPTAQDFYDLRQRFMDRPRVMRILGQNGYKYVRVTPQDLEFRPDIKVVSGSAQPQDKVEDQTRATMLLQATFGNPLAMQIGVDQKKILENYMKGIGITNTEQFFSTPQMQGPIQQIQREHQAFMFGQPVPPTGDDQLHVVVHQLFMQSPYFGRIPEQYRQLFIDHLQAHMNKLSPDLKSPYFDRPEAYEAEQASMSPVGFGG
jgi:hypothetical protein